MDISKRPRIGVIGGSRASNKYLDMAFMVGRMIAEKGGILVCGGMGGIMDAACRGARRAGGLTIGIIPSGQRSDANSHVDVAIATGMGYTRNSLVVMNSDALIAIDGEYGTLSEIAYCCVYEKPIFGLGTWEIKGVIQASDPKEAVDLAFEALKKG